MTMSNFTSFAKLKSFLTSSFTVLSKIPKSESLKSQVV